MSKDVVIDNPVEGGRAKTTINRACELVTKGRAVFTGDLSIRLIDERAQQAMEARCLARRTGLNYDHLNGQWIKHARHIPVIHPELIRG